MSVITIVSPKNCCIKFERPAPTTLRKPISRDLFIDPAVVIFIKFIPHIHSASI